MVMPYSEDLQSVLLDPWRRGARVGRRRGYLTSVAMLRITAIASPEAR